jgi:hypothetical protein
MYTLHYTLYVIYIELYPVFVGHVNKLSTLCDLNIMYEKKTAQKRTSELAKQCGKNLVAQQNNMWLGLINI